MTLLSTIKQYADQIGWQFTDYDHTKTVIVVTIESHRFQTVLALTQKSRVSGREQAIFSSKVCEFTTAIDLRSLLEQSGSFDYSKFIIEDNYLKIEASCLVDSSSPEQLKEMIQEVAQLADHYELKLTGQDLY